MPMPQYNGPMYSQGPAAVGPYNFQGYQPTFGYNPQQTYMPQAPQPAPSQEPMAIPHLIGRSISANDQIPPREIPSDGSPAYFPMQDGSAILVKVWTGNGTIQTVRYIPEQVQQPSQLKTPAPVPAYTVPNPNAYYGCQQNCYQSCGC